ncbi:MAG: hypothetical protein R3A45_12315 [Bdellovibrionota bacterium]
MHTSINKYHENWYTALDNIQQSADTFMRGMAVGAGAQGVSKALASKTPGLNILVQLGLLAMYIDHQSKRYATYQNLVAAGDTALAWANNTHFDQTTRLQHVEHAHLMYVAAGVYLFNWIETELLYTAGAIVGSGTIQGAKNIKIGNQLANQGARGALPPGVSETPPPVAEGLGGSLNTYPTHVTPQTPSGGTSPTTTTMPRVAPAKPNAAEVAQRVFGQSQMNQTANQRPTTTPTNALVTSSAVAEAISQEESNDRTITVPVGAGIERALKVSLSKPWTSYQNKVTSASETLSSVYPNLSEDQLAQAVTRYTILLGNTFIEDHLLPYYNKKRNTQLKTINTTHTKLYNPLAQTYVDVIELSLIIPLEQNINETFLFHPRKYISQATSVANIQPNQSIHAEQDDDQEFREMLEKLIQESQQQNRDQLLRNMERVLKNLIFDKNSPLPREDRKIIEQAIRECELNQGTINNQLCATLRVILAWIKTYFLSEIHPGDAKWVIDLFLNIDFDWPYGEIEDLIQDNNPTPKSRYELLVLLRNLLQAL